MSTVTHHQVISKSFFTSFSFLFFFISISLESAPKLNKASFPICVNCSCFILCNLSWGLNFSWLCFSLSCVTVSGRDTTDISFHAEQTNVFFFFFTLCCFKLRVRGRGWGGGLCRLENVSEIFVKVSIKRKCHVDNVLFGCCQLCYFTTLMKNNSEIL